ncbi:MAG: N-acetylglucosamine kinase, partial [Bacteroidota bacterium]
MLLIADSGSSKTDWRLIDQTGKINQFKTTGLNPYYQSQDSIQENIVASFEENIVEHVAQIFFYGAGCKEEGKVLMETALTKVFNKANVWVGNDLLAAARATCG